MGSTETVFTFIRHGETDWNTAGRLQGHTDIPLNDTGLEQAQQTAAYVAGLHRRTPWQHLYSSDLQRARVTAATIGKLIDLTVSEDAALRERHLGPLEGLDAAAIREQYPDIARHWPHLPPDIAPPGLETPKVIGVRAEAWCAAIAARHPGEAIIAVTHGGWISGLAERLDHVRLPAVRLHNCSVTTIVWNETGGSVVRFGETGHLVVAPTHRLDA